MILLASSSQRLKSSLIAFVTFFAMFLLSPCDGESMQYSFVEDLFLARNRLCGFEPHKSTDLTAFVCFEGESPIPPKHMNEIKK